MMNKRIKEDITRMRKHFNWDQTDTIESMVSSLLEEAKELEASLEEDEEAFKKELADVLMYALSIAYDCDYDIETIIREKIAEVMQRDY